MTGFHEKSLQAGRLLLVLDCALTALVFLAAAHLRAWIDPSGAGDFWQQASLLPLILAIQTPLLWRAGAYERMRVTSLFGYAWIVGRSQLLTVVGLFTTLFMLRVHDVSRGFLLLFFALAFVALVTVRAGLVWWYFRRTLEKGVNFLKVLVIGAGDRARRLTDKLREHSEWGIEVIGYLDNEAAQNTAAASCGPVLGAVDAIAAVLREHVVDEVIVATPRSMLRDIQVIADVCEDEGVKLRFMADVFDLQVSRMSLVNLDEIPLLTFEPVAQDERMLIIKRTVDIVLVALAMPLLIPLMAGVALAVRLDSPGPVLFVQQRVGLRKRTFPMYKFRSMHKDAEARLKDIEHLNEAEGPIFKIANDPRVTRVGRFLRKTSLDEIPQLLNVLRGHMSLVGPRPMSLRDVNQFDRSIQRKRFSVRPGLTCIWQISGRSNLPFHKWLELDLAYIENWSLGLDLKILLKTIPTVLKGSGAV